MMLLAHRSRWMPVTVAVADDCLLRRARDHGYLDAGFLELMLQHTASLGLQLLH